MTMSAIPVWDRITSRVAPGGAGPMAIHAPAAASGERFAAAVERAGSAAQAGLESHGQSAGTSTNVAMSGAVNSSHKVVGVVPDTQVRAKAEGDTILAGLQRIRGLFDERTTALNSTISSKPVDLDMMMSVQKEFVRFSLLVDTASKLAGKSIQALDTLMKAQ